MKHAFDNRTAHVIRIDNFKHIIEPLKRLHNAENANDCSPSKSMTSQHYFVAFPPGRIEWYEKGGLG